MTNTTHSFWRSNLLLIATAGGAGILKATVSTPLDAFGTKQILEHKTVGEVFKEMHLVDYGKGFQANVGKHGTRTPLSWIYVKSSSLVIPTHLDPAVRGIVLGILTGGMETITFNGWNSLRTRFIQGDRWNILKTEGVVVLTKGLSAAFLHRAWSGAIFYGIYEKGRTRFPDQHTAVSTISGFSQVVLTALFYIAAIHKQDKHQAPIRLDRLMLQLYRTHGFARGLFLPALAPRLVNSAITSAPLMWLMEKLHLIHRKN